MRWSVWRLSNSMRKIIATLYTLIVLLLALSTFVEAAKGSYFIQTYVYHTIWFASLWGLLVIALIIIAIYKKMWRSFPNLLLHLSFLFIFAGALLTFLTGIKGNIHLRAGREETYFIPYSGDGFVEFPFTIRLDSFNLEYYPGTNSPSDYKSYVTYDLNGRERLASELFRAQEQKLRGVHPDATSESLEDLDSMEYEVEEILQFESIEQDVPAAEVEEILQVESIEQDVPAGESGKSVCISMNKILKVKGFRFYQASYDNDMQGSLLSVNYDPWGTSVTYAGYILFIISILLIICSRNGTLRKLLESPTLRKGGILIAIILLLPLAGRAENLGHEGNLMQEDSTLYEESTLQIDSLTETQIEALSTEQEQAAEQELPQKFQPPVSNIANYAIPLSEAEELSRTQVLYLERVAPFNTPAIELTRKITGGDSYKELTPEQLIGGIIEHPEEWNREPIIYIKSAQLVDKLRLSTPYASLSALTTEPLTSLMVEAGGDATLAKAVREIDEKIALLLMLERGRVATPLPTDGSVTPLSETKVEAEILYNRIPWVKLLFIYTLTLGFISFLLLLISTIFDIKIPRSISWIFLILLYIALLFHLFGYLLRAYICGHLPIANGYETMQFMALCVLLLSAILGRRFSPIVPFGLLISGFTLLVSYLGEMNPQITPLVPVLASPWLSFHVSFVMVAYTLASFTMLNGIVALPLSFSKSEKRRDKAQQLRAISQLLLFPLVGFLAAGIFMGSIWANVSWGSYWSWDPKEVWALINLMLYATAIHFGEIPALNRDKFFHAYMIFAFLTILMTYFGVGELLGGMHSYA